ncbi:MAG: cbb3-type cytochrome c oxidase subunit I [Candidatus Saccharibacteria bacterium]|nr:cbb3-type cytochrome c oxidase subunit I [Candidatus Saccharibacteria bacterium]
MIDLLLQTFAHSHKGFDPFIFGAQATMVLGALSIIAALTYFKKWTWLWREWLTTQDHKKIGTMYLIVAAVMLLRGVADAVMLRGQQAMAAGSDGFLDAGHFQQVFTAHGTIMIFFVAMGLLFGIINHIMPLQIGARDVAFPFMNSASFWLYAGGAILINVSLLIGGEFAATGWLAYPPLSGLEYSPGPGVDYWLWSIQISGIGSLLSGINFITTIIKKRRAGMSMMKMPVFVWTILGSMTLVVFTFPILTATLLMLSLDRTIATNFFTSSFGGDPMMYINLIWAWGHPEVYILILPAFGIFSEIVATYSKKRLFGYASMVWAIIAITFLSFTVWLHHFFTMGAGANVNAFFGIMTMVIAVPTGVKLFNWLFTMYRGRIHFTSPMIWFFGFVILFTIGGLTGVMMAVPAIDFQVHNSLFLVAHFHNMIIGGVVFGYMAGITYWFPKMFGFKLNEFLGKAAAWSWIVGFIVAFGPLYALGIMGATRRLNTYDESQGWQVLFIVAGVGVLILGAGVLFQLLQLALGIIKRKENKDINGDAWDGRTLEWSIPSPAPVYNFARLTPVADRDAFWVAKQKGVDLKNADYQSISMPKNTSAGFLIGILGAFAGFTVIWHLYLVTVIAVVSIIVILINHLLCEDKEYELPASYIKSIETSRSGKVYL